MALMRSFNPNTSRNQDIVHIMKGELHDKDATAIDDFYKSLTLQKSSLDSEIKNRINLNQKNILQLTDDLRITQEELLLLRVLTKEFLSILSDFAEAAERRLALEREEPKNLDAGPGTQNPLLNRKKKKDRLSVLVLEKMWATELESLYKHVDGAQKYTQPIPGRHVLAESGRWHEINVGTWKASRPIHLFLLNDLVLIATRKLSQEGSSKRLQAIYCWPLLAVELSEIKAPDQVTNKDDKKLYFINLRAPSFSYVYQTDRYDHFVRVTNAYNKGKAELLQKEKNYDSDDINGDFMNGSTNPNSPNLADERADQRHLRNSLRNTNLSELSPGPGDELGYHRRNSSQRHSNDMVLQDISARVHSRNRSHDFNDRLNPSRQMGLGALINKLFMELKNAEDKLDEVDVNLAHSEYEAGTMIMGQIEEKLSAIVTRISGIAGKDKDGSANELLLLVDVVRLKLSNRKYKLQQSLQFDLQHGILTYTNEDIKRILSYYALFEMQSEGINVVLDALSTHLSTTVGKLISGAHGSTKIDILNYILNLTIIYVLIVLKALQIYNGCIFEIVNMPDQKNLDSSGFITWCISEITQLVETIKKHADGTILVYTNEVWAIKDEQHYKELRAVVEPQLDLLKNEGLNVAYLFDDILGSHIKVLS